MPHLSVLMPVRNGADTVGRAARSTLHAMPRDSELLVWDDASTDATLAVLAGIDDRRMRVIPSHVRVGPGAALRELCARTDSALIARMDADDVCLPGRFRLQEARIGQEGTDILFSAILRFRSRPLRFAPSAPLAITAAAMPLHLAVMCVVMHPTMFATRSAVDAAGGYRAVLAEDYDLWLRACTSGGRIERMAVPTVAYRRHSGQTSAAGDFQRRASAESLLAETYRGFIRTAFGIETAWVPGKPAESEEERNSVRAIAATLTTRATGLAPAQRSALARTMRHLPSVD